MPFNTLHPDVLEKIENLCTLGCKKVNNIIQRASQNTDIDELSGFSDAEKQQVIQVLSDIMAMYTDTKN